MKETVDLIVKLCDKLETVNRFCYLGDKINFSGCCEAVVTTRVRVGWVRFRECGELLLENRFSLRIKGCGSQPGRNFTFIREEFPHFRLQKILILSHLDQSCVSELFHPFY